MRVGEMSPNHCLLPLVLFIGATHFNNTDIYLYQVIYITAFLL